MENVYKPWLVWNTMSEEVIKKARELGKALKETEEYKEFVEAQNALDKNEEIQKLLKDYDEKAKDIQLKQMTGENIDEDMTSLQKIEKEIVESETMQKYTIAERKFKELVDSANKAIVESMEGEEEEKE